MKGTPYQGPEVDCWSLGVLLYTLVYGAMPYDGSNFKRLVKQISAGDYYEPKKPSNASPLIREMLTVCPKRRATIEQICNHWYMKIFIELWFMNLNWIRQYLFCKQVGQRRLYKLLFGSRRGVGKPNARSFRRSVIVDTSCGHIGTIGGAESKWCRQ